MKGSKKSFTFCFLSLVALLLMLSCGAGDAPSFPSEADSTPINSSQLAHQNLLRNAPAEFQNMSLNEDDVAALVAFLKSLTEDYDDA